MDVIQTYQPYLEKILASLLLILLLVLPQRWLRRILTRTITDNEKRYQAGKIVGYTTVLIGIVGVAAIWVRMITAFGTLFGIIGAGVAVALKDYLASVGGWIYLVMNRLYDVGDRIQIGDVKGDVVDMAAMRTTLLEVGGWVNGEQSTGRIVHIPNNQILVKPVFNYSRASSYIWADVSATITFESDWKRALDLMTELVKEDGERYARKAREQMQLDSTHYLLKYGKLSPITYLTIEDSGVRLSTRFLVPIRQRRGIESDFQKRLLDSFSKEANITLAYTTYRIQSD